MVVRQTSWHVVHEIPQSFIDLVSYKKIYFCLPLSFQGVCRKLITWKKLVISQSSCDWIDIVGRIRKHFLGLWWWPKMVLAPDACWYLKDKLRGFLLDSALVEAAQAPTAQAWSGLHTFSYNSLEQIKCFLPWGLIIPAQVPKDLSVIISTKGKRPPA